MKKILLIEDNDIDADLLRYILEIALNKNFNMERVSTLGAGLDLLVRENFDVIFLDLDLPDSINFEQTVSSVFQSTPETPILILTGCDDYETGLQAVRLGAQDYLIKGSIPPASIGRCVEFAQIRKQVENSLHTQKEDAFRKNEFKSLFLASMSHDLRSPLTSILNIAPMLKEDENDPKKIELLNVLEKAGETQMQVVDDILDITKLEAGEVKVQFETLNLMDELSCVFDPLQINAEKKGLEMKWSAEDGIARYIETDSVCLRRILYNLVNNAIKFTNKGHVKLRMRIDTDQLYFEVEDTGIGIPANRISEIFKTYEQGDSRTAVRYGGSGIGLSICKQRVELLGGNIGVRSVIGKGSTFYFSIPYRPKENQIQFSSEVVEYKNLSKKRILVADDDESNHVLLKHFLKKTPHEFTMVFDGKQAFEKYKSEEFDLIIMDMQMDIMDGHEAVSLIRQYEEDNNLENIPIIACTASVMDLEVKQCMEEGCTDFVAKPFKPDELYKKIDAA